MHKKALHVEYIFKCGCRKSKYTFKNNMKRCPEHLERLKNKVRFCATCGKECIVSVKSNSKSYIGLCCRRVVTARVRRVYQERHKAPVQSAQFQEGEYRDPEREATRHLRILEKRFPSPVVPEFSDEARRVISG